MKLSEVQGNKIRLSQLNGSAAITKKIGNAEGILQGALKNIGPNTMNFGSVGALSGAENTENDIPDINQLAGNIIGGEAGLMTMGHPNLGAAIGGTIGRTIGETGRQTERALFRAKPFDIREIGKQAAIGGVSEAITLPFASAGSRFLSGPAGKEFKAKIGSTLGNIIDKIQKSGIKVKLSEVVDPLFEAADSIRKNVEVDPSIANFLEDSGLEAYTKGTQKGGFLEASDLKNMKSRLDKFLEAGGIYAGKAKGKAKGAYSAIDDVIGARSAVDQGIQGMAERVGEGKSYETAKGAYSTVAKNFPPTGKHGIMKAFLESGGIKDLLTGNLSGAAGQIMASEGVGSQFLQDAVWKIGKAGKTIPTAIAKLMNNL